MIHYDTLRLLRRRRGAEPFRAALALVGAVCLIASLTAPAPAQTDTPNILWQRGIFSYPRSMTWASNGLIYTANDHTYVGGGGSGYIDVYRASDLTHVQGVKAFPGVIHQRNPYMGIIDEVISTGYPGHIVIAAVGTDVISDPAHPNKQYGSIYPTYTPHLRLYRENLTLLKDIDLSTLPGSEFEA